VKRNGCGLDGLALTGAAGRQLHYPVGSAPGCRDVRWRLFYPQRPGDAAAVVVLVIACLERVVTPCLCQFAPERSGDCQFRGDRVLLVLI